MTPLDILRAARRSVDAPASWGKGAYVSESSGSQCYCALGAILSAGSTASRNATTTAAILFGRAIGKHRDAIPHWNDAPERTHADVIAAFDRAIASLEADRPAQLLQAMTDGKAVDAVIINRAARALVEKDHSQCR
ncbi:MAG: hypothetical protein AB7O57_08330 [Hyphomicrobiaceae bacterium]